MSVSETLATPVLQFEMRTRMRDWRSAALVFAYLAIVALIDGITLWQYGHPVAENRPVPGVHLFSQLALVQLALLSIVTPLVMAGAASGERERGTWEPLLMTPLSSMGIVFSKAAARMSFVLVIAVAALPLVSISFLFGDISLGSALSAYGILLVMALLEGAVTLLISTYTPTVVAAALVSLAASALIGCSFFLLLHSALPDSTLGQLQIVSMLSLSTQTEWTCSAIAVVVSILLLLQSGRRIRGPGATR